MQDISFQALQVSGLATPTAIKSLGGWLRQTWAPLFIGIGHQRPLGLLEESLFKRLSAEECVTPSKGIKIKRGRDDSTMPLDESR